jgi:16S rRNA (adenine1518-N6/adenine1519-N6)-dimethyltransferase
VPRPQRRHGPAPRKELGQHFLRDSGILADIAAAVRVPEDGIVVEIGAGSGELTAALLARGLHVAALEIEPRLVRYLGQRFPGEGRLRIVNGDARTLDTAEVVPPSKQYAIAGNLPYFAANPIVRHFLEAEHKPTEMVIMVQREVAKRMAAVPGKQTLLGLSVYIYSEPEILFDVPPEAFDPPPQVYSTVLRLTLREEPLVPRERIAAFFEMVTRTFRNPRKHMHNALGRGVWLPPAGARAALEAAGIEPMRRPETVTVHEWLALLDAVEGVRASAS